MNQPILLILPLLLFYNFFMTQPILLTCLPALFLIFFMTQLPCSPHPLHPLYFFPKRPLISLSSSISTHSPAPTMLPCILPTPTVPLYQSYFLRIPPCQPFPRSRSRSRSPPRPQSPSLSRERAGRAKARPEKGRLSVLEPGRPQASFARPRKALPPPNRASVYRAANRRHHTVPPIGGTIPCLRIPCRQ